MQKIKLNLKAIPEEKVFVGQKGDYVDLVLHDNKNGTDQYGNDGFVAIDTTKEERDAGTKGVIVGNWRHVGGGNKAQAAAKPYQRNKPATPLPKPAPDPDLDATDEEASVPF